MNINTDLNKKLCQAVQNQDPRDLIATLYVSATESDPDAITAALRRIPMPSETEESGE